MSIPFDSEFYQKSNKSEETRNEKTEETRIKRATMVDLVWGRNFWKWKTENKKKIGHKKTGQKWRKKYFFKNWMKWRHLLCYCLWINKEKIREEE